LPDSLHEIGREAAKDGFQGYGHVGWDGTGRRSGARRQFHPGGTGGEGAG
jgi:hypothetical protein